MDCIFVQDAQTNFQLRASNLDNCTSSGIAFVLGGSSGWAINPEISGNYFSNSGTGINLGTTTNVTLGMNSFFNDTTDVGYGNATFASVASVDGYNGMVLISPGGSTQNVALFSNLSTTSAYIRKIGGTVASPQGFNDCFSRWGGGTFLRSYTDYFCAVLTGNNQYQLQYMPSGVSPIDIGPSTNPYANFNSLAGGGFSIGVFGLSPTNVIHWDSTNLLQLFHLGTSGSGGGVYLCIDSSNHVYQKSSCP